MPSLVGWLLAWRPSRSGQRERDKFTDAVARPLAARLETFAEWAEEWDKFTDAVSRRLAARRQTFAERAEEWDKFTDAIARPPAALLETLMPAATGPERSR